MYIYLISNSATGKYYVGRHKGNNLKKYLQTKISNARKCNGSSHLYASMRKHPKDVWSIHPLVSTLTTIDQLNHWETFFIALFKSRDPQYGYNICRGGEGGFGFTPWNKGSIGVMKPNSGSFQTGNRVNRGRKHSVVRIQQNSDSHKGKPSGMKGKRHTEEAKRKNAEAHRGRKQSAEIIRKRFKRFSTD